MKTSGALKAPGTGYLGLLDTWKFHSPGAPRYFNCAHTIRERIVRSLSRSPESQERVRGAGPFLRIREVLPAPPHPPSRDDHSSADSARNLLGTARRAGFSELHNGPPAVTESTLPPHRLLELGTRGDAVDVGSFLLASGVVEEDRMILWLIRSACQLRKNLIYRSTSEPTSNFALA